MTQFIAWLAATRASALVANVAWIIPAVQCLHIVCVGVVMASVLLLDLRIAVGRGEALTAYTRRYLSWIWMALGLLLATGVILVVGEPNRDLSNATFWLKMALVVAAAVLTAATASRPGRERRFSGRVLALLSLGCWAGAVICGRWIAYTYMN